MPRGVDRVSRVAVIGAGSWGTTTAALLASKVDQVRLWAREPGLAETINETRHNTNYMSGLEIPPGVCATMDLAEATDGAAVVVMAVPSHAFREVAERAAPAVPRDAWVVSLVKGIEQGSLARMSEVLGDVLGDDAPDRIAVLSGPNHAEEVGLGIPTATVIASVNRDVAAGLQELWMTPTFRVYTNSDVAGVELGGATKNVVAIAAGISDGLGYGDNTKASLMTRGLAEMTRLGLALGARQGTFAGLSGMGDLIATCTSGHSRNRGFGELIGRGHTMEEAISEMTMVAEGVRTSRAVAALAEQTGVRMPITDAVVDVLYAQKDPLACVRSLMTRGATDEQEEYADLSNSLPGPDRVL